jgi:hypothetical protein
MQKLDQPEKPGANRLPSAALELGWSQLALGNQQATMNDRVLSINPDLEKAS